jgi:hypothetical protein
VADLVVGAWSADPGGLSRAGAVYLYSAPAAGSIATTAADATLVGFVAEDRGGFSVAFAGDVTGDGCDDLLVGAPTRDGAVADSGVAWLFSGASLSGTSPMSAYLAELQGEAANDQAGRAVAGPGDLNGDGFADMLIGAYSADFGANNAGAAYVVYGPLTGTLGLGSADVRILGDANGQNLGTAVAGAGDLNGDGLPDLAVGLPGDDGAGLDAGAIWVLGGAGF